jgi:hypothetical protein
MTIVAWITDTLELQPAIQRVVAHLNAQLLIITNQESGAASSIDIVIWSPAELDQARYEQLRSWCPRMVICVLRGMVIPRWYPRYDPRWPSYWIVTPFEADEVAFLLERLHHHDPSSRDQYEVS